MIEYLRMLKDGVRHMSYGDPYEGPTVQASDVVQWAVDEIASLLAAGDRLESQLCEAAKERDRLRLAIRRLAEQDATLSVCDGDVTVTMDATLTDAEREAIETAMNAYGSDNANPECAAIEETLWRLLERMR